MVLVVCPSCRWLKSELLTHWALPSCRSRSILATMLFSLAHVVASSATDCWVWEGGSQTIGLATKGLQGPAAGPSARCCSQSWRTGDVLWMYGGGADTFTADMWRMDTSAHPSAWKQVGDSPMPNFGGNSSYPSARTYAVTWARSNGKGDDELWMWGGFGSNHDGDADGHFLSDLYSFDVKTAAWARHDDVKGATPTARQWMNFWPAKGGDEIWMHGGVGAPSPGHSYETPLSDMWKLDVSDPGEKAWEAVYQHPGSPGAHFNGSNPRPGYRSNAYTTVGAGAGDEDGLWLFGGEGGFTSRNGSQVGHDGDFQVCCAMCHRALVASSYMSAGWQLPLPGHLALRQKRKVLGARVRAAHPGRAAGLGHEGGELGRRAAPVRARRVRIQGAARRRAVVPRRGERERSQRHAGRPLGVQPQREAVGLAVGRGAVQRQRALRNAGQVRGGERAGGAIRGAGVGGQGAALAVRGVRLGCERGRRVPERYVGLQALRQLLRRAVWSV